MIPYETPTYRFFFTEVEDDDAAAQISPSSFLIGERAKKKRNWHVCVFLCTCIYVCEKRVVSEENK